MSDVTQVLYIEGVMRKRITNKQIVDTLREIALYLRAQNVAFKPQAYEVAAEGIAGLETELSSLYTSCGEKCIDDVPGVGESIAEKIEELLVTSKLAYYEQLKKKFPFDMLGLSNIQEVGPKTAMKLYKTLQIKTVRDLERAGVAHKIENVPGMGHKNEQKIMRGIALKRLAVVVLSTTFFPTHNILSAVCKRLQVSRTSTSQALCAVAKK